MLTSRRAPERGDTVPLADASVVGDEAEAVDEGSRDDKLVGGVFVKALGFERCDLLGDSWSDWQDGEFGGKSEFEEFSKGDGGFELTEFDQFADFPDGDVGDGKVFGVALESLLNQRGECFAGGALYPGVSVEQMSYLEASHCRPVEKMSPLIRILPLRAPCHVRGLAARKMNSCPSEVTVTVSPQAALLFIWAKFR